MMILRVQQLTVTYQNAQGHLCPVLDALDLEVKKGEIFSIIGPSGCGKTTLLQTLIGLRKANAGKVIAQGRMAMVFQKPQLLPWQTVLENTLFGYACRGSIKPHIRTQAIDLLTQMQLSEHLHDFPHQLSEGMKQRVNLARALLVKPDILLMDEPFSALDLMIRQQLHNDLLDLWQAHPFTIILVSHALDEVANLSDRVAIFSHKPVSRFTCVPINLTRPRQFDKPSTYQWLAEIERLEAILRGEAVTSGSEFGGER